MRPDPTRRRRTGTTARGTVGPRSDLDLLVVLDTEEPFIARLTRLHELLRP
ncbi:MAG: nucleotidyltransferase domain-containing protein, partial [Egibacteraceae bacterium]